MAAESMSDMSTPAEIGGQSRISACVLPFPELSFIRLSDGWQEIRESLLLGDPSFDPRILRQYQLSWAPQVMLDFWYRGAAVSDRSAQSFSGLLKRPGSLAHAQLSTLAEVLGVIWQSADVNQIEAAEIMVLQARPVMTVCWINSRVKRRYLSVFVDALGDGRVIREIHFSAPFESFTEHLTAAFQCLDSIQWDVVVPPPMSSIA